MPGVDADLVGQHVAARLDGHHDLFQRGVAGPLADAVDGAFDLPAAGADAGQRVGHRHAEIVVAVHGEDHLLRARHLLHHGAEHLEVFLGRGVAHGVGQVDGGGAGLDARSPRSGTDSRSRCGWRPPPTTPRPPPSCARAATWKCTISSTCSADFCSLCLRCTGEVAMKVWMRGRAACLHGLAGAVDVELAGPRQAAHHRPLEALGDLGDGLEVALRGDREARLDDVDAHRVEEVGDLQLLLEGHGGAGALLAVAQRGVEDEDAGRCWWSCAAVALRGPAAGLLASVMGRWSLSAAGAILIAAGMNGVRQVASGPLSDRPGYAERGLAQGLIRRRVARRPSADAAGRPAVVSPSIMEPIELTGLSLLCGGV